MSEENVELLRRGVEHFKKTGEILPETVHPDFIWDMTTFRDAIAGGTYVGVDAANEWNADWLGVFQDWSVDVEEFIDAGDQVIVVARHRGEPKHGGPRVEMRIAQIWTFRDGLATRMQMYADPAEALEAAGLSE